MLTATKKILMEPADVAKAYIYRLCQQVGTNADSIYNPKTGAWYFSNGASTIEVFLTTLSDGQERERTFIRCFAPVYSIPADAKKKWTVLETALEINTERMGIKLSTLANKGLLCVVTERDIDGMDYQEFITIISDISYWAGQLSDYFEKRFGK
jgi:hypothetical protein